MLDVHPPDHSLHGPRDFAIHLATITVGLLIALGLEAAVEWAHHRHERKEAEAMIRQELRQNRDEALAGIPVVTEESANLQRLLAFVQARQQGKDVEPKEISLKFQEAPMNDSAWRTAAATGALTYMDYAEVQRFSQAYKEQDLLQRNEEAALDDYLQMQSVMRSVVNPRELTKEEATMAMPYVQRSMAHLNGMLAVGEGMLHAYGEALE